MNKAEMKRKNIEEANIMLEKRARQGNNKEVVVKDTTKKDNLKDRLMNQLKSGK
jgi:hypothetical protein